MGTEQVLFVWARALSVRIVAAEPDPEWTPQQPCWHVCALGQIPFPCPGGLVQRPLEVDLCSLPPTTTKRLEHDLVREREAVRGGVIEGFGHVHGAEVATQPIGNKLRTHWHHLQPRFRVMNAHVQADIV